jgi:riboflavin biosynthesis pyrimidine reductase
VTLSAAQWRDRYRRWSEDKIRRAAAAVLPPYVTEIERPEEEARAIGNELTRELFDGPFYISLARDARRPACSLVFVQSADGNTGAADPATLGGGSTDKHLIYEGLSRVAADAVMAGAATVRGSDVIFSVWRPELVDLRQALGLPRHPVQIVLTNRGLDSDAELILNVPEIPVLLLLSASALHAMRAALASRPWVQPLQIEEQAGLPETFARLAAMGIGTISCVGGRTLASALLDARVVDEVYLTTGPRPGGEPATPLHPGPWRDRTIVRKRGTGEEAGVIFEHVLPRG